MQNYFRNKVSIWAVLFSLTIPFGAHGSDLLPGGAHNVAETNSSAASVQEKFVSLKIPLFSPHFAKTPVALVNDEAITLTDLTESLGAEGVTSIKSGAETAIEYQNVLERLIISKLFLLEAKNIGLDETSAIQTEIEEFRTNTLLQKLIDMHLHGLELDPADVDDVYQQMSREVQLHTLTFETSPEAQQFLDEVKDGDFDQLASRYIEEGKAKGKKEENFTKIKDLLPQVGKLVYSMKVGGVSNIFRTEEGFLLFQLTDTRFVEDEPVRQEAVRIVSDTLKKQKAMEYSNTLSDKYFIFNEELYNQLDFDQDFEQLKGDKRVIASSKGSDPMTITVGDLAAKLEVKFFHGADKAQKLKMLNKRKDIEISNMLFKITGVLEAEHLGLDKTGEFIKKMKDFERNLLFQAFMEKIIIPDVKLTAEETRAYYDEHLGDYSSPAMLRMSSLVFTNRDDAENALDKLHKGADFKWVSANATGFVSQDTEGLLPFDKNLLSLTSLPEDLQESARGVKKGDSIVYAEPEGNYYYLLLMDEVFPPEPQAYEQAKNAVARTVFDIKAKQLLAEWTAKLKEAYATQIFLTERGQ